MIARLAPRSPWLLFAALVCGCQRSSGLGRIAVGGTVTRAGAPLASGLISFRPAQGRSGPAATTAIREGHYQFDARNGPTSGPHQVVILAAVEGKQTHSPPATSPDGLGRPSHDPGLHWTFDIDVPAAAPTEIPFQLP